VVLKAGKNREGCFSANDLLKQVEHSIDIFETKTNGFSAGLFMFGNSPSHQQQAPDALTAQKMPKHPNKDQLAQREGQKCKMGGMAQIKLHKVFLFSR